KHQSRPAPRSLNTRPTRRSSDLAEVAAKGVTDQELARAKSRMVADMIYAQDNQTAMARIYGAALTSGQSVDDVYGWTDRIEKVRSEEHTSELQSRENLVCRLLLE